MITSFKDRITTGQVTVIVANAIFGVGTFTLPRTAVEKVKTPDIWISVILGGLIAMIAGVIMVKLSEQFPGKTFYEYSQEIVGKWVGGFLSLLIVCYFFSSCGFQVRALAEVSNLFLLEGTPTWAIIMTFLWVGLYLIIGGINPIARMFEIILPITIIIFIIVAFMSFKIFEIDNLRPVLGLGVIPVLKGVQTTGLSYTGVETILFLLPFMKEPKKAVKALLVGVSIPLIFYLITVVMVIGGLSVDGVVTRTWPTLDLIRSFEVTGLIFERYESLLLVIWIMQMFSAFTIFYYGAALGLAQLFKKSIRPFMYGLLPVIYIIAMIPKNTNDMFKFGDLQGNVALYLFGLLPLVLLMVSRWKVRKHEEKS
ncbi:spore germination protein [Bacillus sp. ISL-4]|uniref:spore germination protein n=1 Tax=Bacillus sp. ISL-4 TaxID=2819125 RepID=UPI001BE6B1DC|nr:spore germination protein [Bacillus sp. ISL-4]MBT2667575.1 spore germination protein [Bacillus sp. ISL-4]MBT2671189.1 spore germination protein [Streptomyces sp. ISL-14]